MPINGSYYLPYQRGGDYYEPEFGHWRTWGVKYYPDLLKVNLNQIVINCPYCQSKLSLRSGKHGEYYACLAYPSCNFTLPKLLVFETVETGYAEYERWKDHKIFHVKLNDKQITIQEKMIATF